MEGIFGALFLIGMGWLFLSPFQHEHVETERLVYTEALSERIRRIAYLSEQITALDELITDIQSSDYDLLKYLTVSRTTLSGVQVDIDLYMDGHSQVTMLTLALAEAQKQQLLERMDEELEALPYRERRKVMYRLRRGTNGEYQG